MVSIASTVRKTEVYVDWKRGAIFSVGLFDEPTELIGHLDADVLEQRNKI